MLHSILEQEWWSCPLKQNFIVIMEKKSIVLFKTHFSIGKSILTEKKCFELGRDLDEVVFLEDSFSGFRKIKSLSKKMEKPMRFGVSLLCSHGGNKASKVNLFADNNDGLRELRQIFTKSKTEGGVWEFDESSLKNITLAIPFYNSYVHKSLHNFGVYDLPVDKYVHFIEENEHPYDYQIKRAVDLLEVDQVKTQTVCYEKQEYFKEYQWYRATCNRSGGRKASFGKPELEDCGSDQFFYHYDSRKS